MSADCGQDNEGALWTHDTKVLIVEDEEILRGVLTEVFENAGYVVASATNGAEALCQLSHQQPDIVLTDLMMPVMDGLEFCNRARMNSDVPIMVLSSLAEEQGRTASLLAGATAYAHKSTAMEEILRQADSILAGDQGQRRQGEPRRRSLVAWRRRVL